MHITNITSVTAAQINSTLGSVTQNSTVFRVLDWLAFKALSPTLWALVAAVINVPSIVLYILEVVELLLSWSEFRTPFYILFLIRAFGVCLQFLTLYSFKAIYLYKSLF
jgi:hypothetical protein